VHTLEQIGQNLRAQLGTANIPKLLNTRIFLRTGVSLADVRPTQNADPSMIEKVAGALRDFGYTLP
jgi:hypothetical protein